MGSCGKALHAGSLIHVSNAFLTALEAGSSRSMCQHGPVRTLVQVTEFSLCPHVVEGAREFSGAVLVRAIISFLKAPP